MISHARYKIVCSHILEMLKGTELPLDIVSWEPLVENTGLGTAPKMDCSSLSAHKKIVLKLYAAIERDLMFSYGTYCKH